MLCRMSGPLVGVNQATFSVFVIMTSNLSISPMTGCKRLGCNKVVERLSPACGLTACGLDIIAKLCFYVGYLSACCGILWVYYHTYTRNDVLLFAQVAE